MGVRMDRKRGKRPGGMSMKIFEKPWMAFMRSDHHMAGEIRALWIVSFFSKLFPVSVKYSDRESLCVFFFVLYSNEYHLAIKMRPVDVALRWNNIAFHCIYGQIFRALLLFVFNIYVLHCIVSRNATAHSTAHMTCTMYTVVTRPYRHRYTVHVTFFRYDNEIGSANAFFFLSHYFLLSTIRAICY